jgi:hypothetical protein
MIDKGKKRNEMETKKENGNDLLIRNLTILQIISKKIWRIKIESEKCIKHTCSGLKPRLSTLFTNPRLKPGVIDNQEYSGLQRRKAVRQDYYFSD